MIYFCTCPHFSYNIRNLKFRLIVYPPLPMQVASGLAYLHERKIVYYDLKSPNILVFQFPSPDESLMATQPSGYQGEQYQRKNMHS